jgi:hypothetical protein
MRGEESDIPATGCVFYITTRKKRSLTGVIDTLDIVNIPRDLSPSSSSILYTVGERRQGSSAAGVAALVRFSDSGAKRAIGVVAQHRLRVLPDPTGGNIQ